MPAIAGFAVLAFSLGTGAAPVRAFEERSGQVHIVKDCMAPGASGVPGNAFCAIVSSNLDVLPVGSRIYYDQISGGPDAGPGYLDSNIFVYVKTGQWAVGRCTIANDNGSAGLCTISDGSGPLARFSARIVVTYKPGGDGALYAWDGTYSFDSDK
jgi:hypothetical protein